MLIQCQECGKEISQYAKICPNCGAPNLCYLAKRRVHREKVTNNEIIKNSDFGENVWMMFSPLMTLVGVLVISMILSKMFSGTWFIITSLQICCLFFFWPTWFLFHAFAGFFEVLFVEVVLIVIFAFDILPSGIGEFMLGVLPIIVVLGETMFGVYSFFTRPDRGRRYEPMTDEDMLLDEMEDL